MEVIVGKTAGFCYGVKRAVDESLKLASEKVYCLGDIVNNKNVVNDLSNKGIIFINDINDSKGKTIIRAHGVSKEIYDIAKEKNIELVDLTCPSVLKIHKIVDDYDSQDYYILITGKKDHPEIIGIKSHARRYSIIYNIEDIDGSISNIRKDDKVLLISQTTYNSGKFDEIAEILKKKINDLEVKKTICPSTNIRQEETISIAKEVDLMIIIGDKNSSNTSKLYDVASKYCNNVIFVMDANDLDTSILKSMSKVGVMAGASTPQSDIEKITNIIKEIN